MPINNIIALDVGGRRIGVAVAHAARLAAPLGVIDQGDGALGKVSELVEREAAKAVVVGLPRGLDGQETKQTADVRQFAERLRQNLPIPVYFVDEAVTSKQAEAELQARGHAYTKGDIDALAATLILEDWLQMHKGD